jgi:hypothetical protein
LHIAKVMEFVVVEDLGCQRCPLAKVKEFLVMEGLGCQGCP